MTALLKSPTHFFYVRDVEPVRVEQALVSLGAKCSHINSFAEGLKEFEAHIPLNGVEPEAFVSGALKPLGAEVIDFTEY